MDSFGSAVWSSVGKKVITGLTGFFLIGFVVVHLIAAVGASDVSVLIQGETGTGKGTVARLLHDLSPRARQPFAHVDCAALAPSLPWLARLVWIVGASLQLGLTLAVISGWIGHNPFLPLHISPAWFIPAVGNIVARMAFPASMIGFSRAMAAAAKTARATGGVMAETNPK